MEKLEKKQRKELELAKQHEQNCNDLRKQIEMERGNMIQKSINRLNLSAEEFQLLMKVVQSKKNFLEAVELIKEQREETRKEHDEGERSI